MTRRPEVTKTRFHPAGCTCDDSDCLARAIKLDVTAVYDRPPPARCDDPVSLLRGEDDADVALARKAGG
ncbi:MAG: hypothetical protein U0324_44000 [Polyangiales bacterium]